MELKVIENKNIISKVKKGSIAEELGVEAGDYIISINDTKIEDVIEYHYLESDDYVELEIKHKNGETVIYEIEKDYDEEIGLEFTNPIIDSVKSCSNKCIFCFIDQLPKGMRETLYIKDDDSRLSFLQGNFITMTNMKDEDIEKIINYRISPINISVHTTNPKLRIYMLKNKNASNILKNIERLNESNIQMNGQIVCIPNINDKEELDRTVEDLSKYYPNMQSVAVVPVGITKHRDKLAKLEIFDEKTSFELIKQVEKLQKKFLKKLGTRFIFASDEFYILAKQTLPQNKEYEGYIQIENGVGLIRKFSEEIDAELKRIDYIKLKKEIKITIATGISAFEFMKDIARRIELKINNLKINVVCIMNNFFGNTITVAGLITGKDLVEQLRNVELGEALFLPRVMFRSDELIFLDDIKLDELEKMLNKKVVVNEIIGKDLINNILSIGE